MSAVASRSSSEAGGLSRGPSSSALSSQLPPSHHADVLSVGLAPASAGPIISRPAVIEHGNYRFLVHDAPTDSNLSSYLDFMKRKSVVALVRACEPTYDKTPLEAAGIKVVELPFADGLAPPENVITSWLALVASSFEANGGGSNSKKSSSSSKDSKSSKSDIKSAIAVHCVAGLGRAPVLVCLALIESGMGWMEAVELVRKKRRGALNLTQLKYLETYKPRGKKDSCCVQ